MRHATAGLLAVGLAVLLQAGEPEIEFSGVLVAGPQTKVALAQKGAGPAQWVTVGEEFGGFTVSAYESGPETVVLTKDGQKLRVKLKEAKVVAGVIEPPPEIKAAILDNLHRLCALADQYYLENGRSTVTYAELFNGTWKIKGWKPVESKAGEDYSGIKFEQGKPIAVTTAGGCVLSVQP